MQTFGAKEARTGRLRPSGVTLKHVARQAGLDVSTVSRALAGAAGVNPETRKKVLALAERLGYRPNLIARGLVTGRSHSIGLLISDIRNPFFAEVARGAEDAARAAGHDVILCNSDMHPQKQWEYLRSLCEKRVTGIMMNFVGSFTERQQEETAACGVPIVLFNPPVREVPMFSSLTADNVAGGELAANYLIGLGHQRIAHFTGPADHGNFVRRREGFENAARAAGVETIVLEGDHTFHGGYQLTWKLLAQYPGVTAIFAANDITAFGVLRALSERGLRVPQDMSLLGFDNIELASVVNPRLTTINQPKWELGHTAVEMLIRQEKQARGWEPEHLVLNVSLVEGASCARLSQPASGD